MDEYILQLLTSISVDIRIYLQENVIFTEAATEVNNCLKWIQNKKDISTRCPFMH